MLIIGQNISAFHPDPPAVAESAGLPGGLAKERKQPSWLGVVVKTLAVVGLLLLGTASVLVMIESSYRLEQPNCSSSVRSAF